MTQRFYGQVYTQEDWKHMSTKHMHNKKLYMNVYSIIYNS